MTNNNTDEFWVEKLRRENCDQFNTLVKMHLSFVLDLNTDDNDCMTEKNKFKKWSFVPFTKKPKSNRGIMEGAPLTQEGICQIYQLIEYLTKEPNICAEGIFRRTGSLSRQQELRNLLNQGVSLDLDGGRYSVHDCASVLKGFLAEQSEPLLSDAHYAAYLQLAELCDKPANEERLLRGIQLLLLLLPSENRQLLRDVLLLLNKTTSYEHTNKMSADSLATLFTPHLLCPRRLSPEALHSDASTLSAIVSFMIRKGFTVFEIPSQLTLDIRTYLTEQKKKCILDESASDGVAANTVYSFLDHEKTAAARVNDPTEAALAQLYAYIQGLPESSKKRKLVKKFNRENGNGTPLQIQRASAACQRSLGDSIKKHFLQGFGRRTQARCSSEEVLNSPSCVPITAKTKLFCVDCDDSSSEPEETPARCYSEPDLSSDGAEVRWASYLTSTPAICVEGQLAVTPNNPANSVSPITRSTQRMSKAMQESMMTPRSRKPVLLVSNTNICNLAMKKPTVNVLELVEEDEPQPIMLPRIRSKSEGDLFTPKNTPKNVISTCSEPDDSLTVTFKEYLCSRSILTATPVDLSFSSRTDDYNSDQLTESMLYCLDGNDPYDSPARKRHAHLDDCSVQKKLVLKPSHYDSNGDPVMFETSF